MKKTFRKIATVAMGALTIGASVGFAAAAAYPMPFVSNGVADVAVVYGANANPTDMTGAANIAADLNEDVVAGTAGGSTTVTGGDSVKLEKTSTKFNLGDYAGDVVSTTVTDDQLPTLLADGKFTDDDNDEFDYTQKIELNNATLRVTMFEDNDYKAEEPVLGVRIANGANILNYTLDFTDDPLWSDLATADLPFMGKNYYVLSNGTLGNTLTLLDSAVDTILSEGEKATLNVDGKTYEVEINFVGSAPEVKLSVNGEITNTLNEGQTYKLDDGSYVGVKDILYSDKDTGVSKVEFSIGNGKLLLTNNSNVELNEESISDLTTVFTTDGTSKLQTIKVVWDADDDLFVAEDSTVTMPGFGAVKLAFGGLTYPAEENLVVEADGDNSAVLKNFPMKDSTESINFLYFNGTNYTMTGKDSNNLLATSGNSTLTFDGDTDDWFLVSWNDTQDHESYLMRATNFKNESGTQRATFQYRNDEVWSDVKVDAEPADTITLGNVEFTVTSLDKDTKVAVIDTSTTGVSFNILYSAEGMKVEMPWINETSHANQSATRGSDCWGISPKITTVGQLGYNITVNNSDGGALLGYCEYLPATYSLNLREEDKNENLMAGSNITVVLSDDANNEVSAETVNGANSAREEIDDTDVFRSFVYSELATEILEDESSDQESVTLIYHGEEVTAAVYLTAPDATVVGDDSSEAGAITVEDTEVSTVSSKNLVVVGGSAINSVAAELLGGDYRGEMFTSETGVADGEFLVEVFASPYTSGKVAMLVAGYSAADTTKAVTYVTNNDVDTTVGTKLKGTSATEATVVTA